MSQKGLVPILILLEFTLLAGFVIYQKQTISPALKPTEQPTSSDETVYTEALRSADWKTYKNDEYSFSYPPDWKVSESADITYIFSPNKAKDNQAFHISVIVDQSTIPAEEWLKQGMVGGVCCAEEFTLEPFSDETFQKVVGKIHKYPGAIAMKDGKIYYIYSQSGFLDGGVYYYDKDDAVLMQNIAVFDQILSTFRFTDSNTQNHVLLPKQDLAKKLGVKEEDISLVSVEETQWNDSSLGCPKEGMFYAQVITPGYKIILSYNHPLAEFQKTYTYHTDMKGNYVSCDK